MKIIITHSKLVRITILDNSSLQGLNYSLAFLD